jgi:hypothetical protein
MTVMKMRARRVIIDSNVVACERTRKVFVCCLEMRTPDVVSAEASTALESDHDQTRSDPADLGISQSQAPGSFQQLLAWYSEQLERAAGAFIVVNEASDEDHRRG